MENPGHIGNFIYMALHEKFEVISVSSNHLLWESVSRVSSLLP